MNVKGQRNLLILSLCYVFLLFVFVACEKTHGYLRRSTISMVNDTTITSDLLKSSSTNEMDFELVQELEMEYNSKQKILPYVGHNDYIKIFQSGTRKYYNSYAVFLNADKHNRMHGYLGLYKNGTQVYKRKPEPPDNITDSEKSMYLKKGGGFFVEKSNSLPLDRVTKDLRSLTCKNINYNYTEFPDVTVIINVYNEQLSILLRSLHSILNFTPPPLLREIIIVDDFSFVKHMLPGEFVDSYIKHLPKVKIIRLGERRGLVHARLIGAKIARAPVFVVLDSHIEVCRGWLEPMLHQLNKSPESFVFPQIPSIDPFNFEFHSNRGIGCYLSFYWMMQEMATAPNTNYKPEAIESPVMAGGIFAARRDWFWEVGGYDEHFSMWGAENVEIGFRGWMCGGKLECTPCSYVYHIYRKDGTGYKSPPLSLKINRLRTARTWTGDFYKITDLLLQYDNNFNLGSFKKVNKLKERLQCRDFKWFLRHVDKDHSLDEYDMKKIFYLKEIKNVFYSSMCLDTLWNRDENSDYSAFFCHKKHGSQGFFYFNSTRTLRPSITEKLCLHPNGKMEKCKQKTQYKWIVDVDKKLIMWEDKPNSYLCLTLNKNEDQKHTVSTLPCKTENNTKQQWLINMVNLSEVWNNKV